jgi:hypothetical protein
MANRAVARRNRVVEAVKGVRVGGGVTNSRFCSDLQSMLRFL